MEGRVGVIEYYFAEKIRVIPAPVWSDKEKRKNLMHKKEEL
jgi:hypothetical protein